MDYKSAVAAAVASVGCGLSMEELSALIVVPKDSKNGDYSLPCFRFAKISGKSPVAVAQELKDKIVTIPVTDMAKEMNMEMTPQDQVNSYEDVLASQAGDPNKMEDAISALVNLGYQRLEAYKAVNQAALQAPDADMGELIKLALREFAKKD